MQLTSITSISLLRYILVASRLMVSAWFYIAFKYLILPHFTVIFLFYFIFFSCNLFFSFSAKWKRWAVCSVTPFILISFYIYTLYAVKIFSSWAVNGSEFVIFYHLANGSRLVCEVVNSPQKKTLCASLDNRPPWQTQCYAKIF